MSGSIMAPSRATWSWSALSPGAAKQPAARASEMSVIWVRECFLFHFVAAPIYMDDSLWTYGLITTYGRRPRPAHRHIPAWNISVPTAPDRKSTHEHLPQGNEHIGEASITCGNQAIPLLDSLCCPAKQTWHLAGIRIPSIWALAFPWGPIRVQSPVRVDQNT